MSLFLPKTSRFHHKRFSARNKDTKELLLRMRQEKECKRTEEQKKLHYTKNRTHDQNEEDPEGDYGLTQLFSCIGHGSGLSPRHQLDYYALLDGSSAA